MSTTTVATTKAAVLAEYATAYAGLKVAHKAHVDKLTDVKAVADFLKGRVNTMCHIANANSITQAPYTPVVLAKPVNKSIRAAGQDINKAYFHIFKDAAQHIDELVASKAGKPSEADCEALMLKYMDVYRTAYDEIMAVNKVALAKSAAKIVVYMQKKAGFAFRLGPSMPGVTPALIEAEKAEVAALAVISK